MSLYEERRSNCRPPYKIIRTKRFVHRPGAVCRWQQKETHEQGILPRSRALEQKNSTYIISEGRQ